MPDPCRIWCGGLPSDISEPELYSEFSKHGQVITISIRSSPHDTFAFVEMDGRGAEVAIRAMSRAPLWGSPHLNVRIASDNQSRGLPGSGGGRGDRPPPRRPLPKSPESERRGSGTLVLRSPPHLDDDWDPFDLWRDCLAHRGLASAPRSPGCDRALAAQLEEPRRSSPRAQSRHGGEPLLVARPARWAGQAGRDRSPRRCLRSSRRGRSGSRPPSPPPPPPSSAEHALYEGGAVEWRARHLCITLENIPLDMTWLELKNLGRLYGFVAHARTYRDGGVNMGALEFSQKDVLERAARDLDGQMIEGARHPLKVHLGAPSEALVPKCLAGPRARY